MAPPRWDAAISCASPLSSSSYPSFWVSVAKRLMRQTSTSTGKQYELDQAQAGQMHPTLDNRDATFSPVNTASPYSPQVAPFTPMRLRAQYPMTPNILTTDQATGGSLAPVGQNVDLVVPVWISYNFFWTVKAESDAFTGPNVFQQIVSTPQATGWPSGDMDGWTVMPGVQHSAQCVMRATAGGTTPQVRLILIWRDVTGTQISTSTGGTVTLTANSRVWQQLTVSGTAPVNAAGATLQIQMVNSVAVTWQASGFQVEYSAAPTAWSTPGIWYPVFYGGTERWPQIYDMQGTFGQTQPVVVDPFALLAAVYPQPPFINDVLATSPRFFFPLTDPPNSVQVTDTTGKRPPAQLRNTPLGSGTLVFGDSVQATTSPAGSFLGYPGPVARFDQVDPTASLTSQQAATYIDLTSAGVVGPDISSGGFTRMIAFRCAAIPTVTGALWAYAQATYSGGQGHTGLSIAGMDFAPPGRGTLVVSDITGTYYNTSLANLCDGNWHLVFFGIDNTGGWTFVLDGQIYNYTGMNGSVTGIVSDTVGLAVMPGAGYYVRGSTAQIGAYAEWPGRIGRPGAALDNTAVSSLYTSWRSAWQGDPTGFRYTRILNYAGYPGQRFINVGATSRMGPATDIDGKTDALTLLQNVVTTENGVHYVDANGPIVFEARTNRYNKLTPTYTFGERTDLGEWPYENVAFDYDTTHVIGQAQVTQNMTGQTFVANAATTIAPGYRPTFQRTINVESPLEAVDAANYLVNQHAKPRLRVINIRLHPAAVAGLWPVALFLRISTRIRVMRRAPGAPTIQFDGFIESLKWTLDWTTGDHFLDLEVSPADLQLYWLYAALHTTLFSQANSGGNTAVLSPLPDSASNPFSASVCSGLQLTLEPGTVRSETLTVQSVSATAPGYTSVTVTFTSALAFTHAVNTTVCEALPSGVTDPTVYDPAAILGTTTVLAY